ncbi:MAG: HEAT repeat domain-containing protein [Candidatus Ozemobacteraceae bacterium]
MKGVSSTAVPSQQSWEAFLESLYSPLPNLREMAVLELQGWADTGRDVSEVLCISLLDPESIVSRAAAVVAGRIANPSEIVAKALAQRLMDNDPLLRRTVVTALGRMGIAGCPFLVRLLLDRDPFIRQYAAMSLEHMGTDAGPELLNALPDPGLRRPAASILAHIGTPVAPLLIEHLDAGISLEVRYTVMDTLERIGPMVVPLMIEEIKAGRRDKENAAEAFGHFGPDAVPALIEMLRDPDVKHRCSAAAAIVKVGRPAVPRLIDALSDPNVGVSWLAGQALGQIGSASVPDLIQALATTGRATRWVVSEILISLGEQAVGALMLALRSGEPLIREAAAHSLAEIGASAWAALPDLKDAMERETDPELGCVFQEAIDKLSVHD